MPVSAVAPKITLAAVDDVITVAAMTWPRCQLVTLGSHQPSVDGERNRPLEMPLARGLRHTTIPKDAKDKAPLWSNSVDPGDQSFDVVCDAKNLCEITLQILSGRVVGLHQQSDRNLELEDSGVRDTLALPGGFDEHGWQRHRAKVLRCGDRDRVAQLVLQRLDKCVCECLLERLGDGRWRLLRCWQRKNRRKEEAHLFRSSSEKSTDTASCESSAESTRNFAPSIVRLSPSCMSCVVVRYRKTSSTH